MMYVCCFGAMVKLWCVRGGQGFSIEVVCCGEVGGFVWVWCHILMGVQDLCGVVCCGLCSSY